MAWYDEAVPLLRGLIGDIESTTYTDETLMEYIVYGGFLCGREINFSTDYTIDFTTQTISPDPESDRTFISLACKKAALLIVCNELKVAGMDAVRVNDGPSSIDYTMVYKAKKELFNILKEDFEKSKLIASMGELNTGEAILTPYTQESILGYYYR